MQRESFEGSSGESRKNVGNGQKKGVKSSLIKKYTFKTIEENGCGQIPFEEKRHVKNVCNRHHLRVPQAKAGKLREMAKGKEANRPRKRRKIPGKSKERRKIY